MKKTQETLKKNVSTKAAVLHVAFELSNSKWKLGFSDGNKMRFKSVDARNLEQLEEEIEKAKSRFRLDNDVRIVSCYEAGRDGFWLHRYLLNQEVENVVVDSSSIEVNRRKRRAKTDRIDARKLLNMLMRYHGGERKLWSVVRVPSVEAEDGRQLSRELESLNKERTRHRSRIRGLLILEGLEVKNPSGKKFLEELDSLCTWDGKQLPGDFKARIVREYERLRMVEEQMGILRKEREIRVGSAETLSMRKVAQLRTLYGIGVTSSWDFVMEMFGWREFRNRREVGAFAGLTPTPYDSGGSQREQGISKAGRGRIRALNIQIAWGWLRFQPQSKLSQWYQERFAGGGSRMRRIGIVAVARKLLIDLWRYLEYGVVPEGVRLRLVK
ncbi:MAG: IS110 family transposase [Desulfobacterales bacterium]|nr:IS110 family transposase [Pseudomonadota bacterium]MCG2774066.1 IS110 family transposase [Desulfobacterales bacterium]